MTGEFGDSEGNGGDVRYLIPLRPDPVPSVIPARGHMRLPCAGAGGLLHTLQVIRLRLASESLAKRYPSSLLWEDLHEAIRPQS